MATRSPKAQAHAAWGKLANIDAILSACQALEAEGGRLNRDTLKDRSGVTANNELAAGLALYKARKPLLDQLPTTPVAEVICRAVEREFHTLRDGFADSLAAEKAAFGEALSAAGAEYQDLAREHDLLDVQVRAQCVEIEALKILNGWR